jgi:hypothetical protein
MEAGGEGWKWRIKVLLIQANMLASLTTFPPRNSETQA